MRLVRRPARTCTNSTSSLVSQARKRIRWIGEDWSRSRREPWVRDERTGARRGGPGPMVTARQSEAEPVAPGGVEADAVVERDVAARTPSWSLGSAARTRPLPSMKAEMPVLTARARGTRFSTARKTLTARCMSCSEEPWNQPSFERLSRTSGWRPAVGRPKNRRTTWGTVSSKQMAAASRYGPEVEPGRLAAEGQAGDDASGPW